MMSTSTGGGFDINCLSVVKKSAAALTCKNRTLSRCGLDDWAVSGRCLSPFSAYSARFWIRVGVSKTSEMVYVSSQNSVGCC